MHDDPELQRKFASILPNLDERQRRLLAAAEARALGYGGVRRVSRASGISHTAIQRALKRLDAPPPPAGHVRRPGGGRKKVRDKSPAILAALEEKSGSPPTHGAIPCPRYGGPARAPANWPRPSPAAASASAIASSASCSITSATASRPMPRRGRASG